jgi:Lrp/AsnC family transcriptional regulator of ectoine degradation
MVIDRLALSKESLPMKLDELDIKILAALQCEGRMTKLKLAETINLSPTPCWEPLRRW